MSSRSSQASFSLLRSVYSRALSAVSPAHRLRQVLTHSDRVIQVEGRSYNLDQNCYLVGFGKAVMGMAMELANILGPNLKEGILSVPVGSALEPHLPGHPCIRVCQGAANNLPDRNAEHTAHEITSLVRGLQADDLLFVVVSGGGSALLPFPMEPVTLDEKFSVIKSLSNAGATINELNSVRKRLSAVKGGKLGRLSYPTPTVSFILSDIIGDPLDLISSGPTAADSDPKELADEILSKFGVSVPRSVTHVLTQPFTPTNSNDLEHVQNVIIGNLDLALEGISKHFYENGVKNLVWSNNIDGLVSDVASDFADLAYKVCFNQGKGSETPGIEAITSHLHEVGQPVALISGGEPTVHVVGSGKGGRNQELVVRFSVEFDRLCAGSNLRENFDVFFMSAGTDGIDGPTDAAGAMADNGMISQCLEQGLSVSKYVSNNDCYTLLSALNAGRNLIKVGHTGTNVMDVHCMLIQKKCKI